MVKLVFSYSKYKNYVIDHNINENIAFFIICQNGNIDLAKYLYLHL